MVNRGIALKDILRVDVRKSDWYVVSFDESMNDKTQTSDMDICLRSWNDETNKV